MRAVGVVKCRGTLSVDRYPWQKDTGQDWRGVSVGAVYDGALGKGKTNLRRPYVLCGFSGDLHYSHDPNPGFGLGKVGWGRVRGVLIYHGSGLVTVTRPDST